MSRHAPSTPPETSLFVLVLVLVLHRNAVTVSSAGPRGLFKGMTTATSGVLAGFPLLLPVRNSVASYGASVVTRTSDRGHVAEVKNQCHRICILQPRARDAGNKIAASAHGMGSGGSAVDDMVIGLGMSPSRRSGSPCGALFFKFVLSHFRSAHNQGARARSGPERPNRDKFQKFLDFRIYCGPRFCTTECWYKMFVPRSQSFSTNMHDGRRR